MNTKVFSILNNMINDMIKIEESSYFIVMRMRMMMMRRMKRIQKVALKSLKITYIVV